MKIYPYLRLVQGLSHASEEITHTYLRSFSDEQLAVVNLQMAALVNPMAAKEWKRKEKGNYKVRKSTKNEFHISVPIPGRKRNGSAVKELFPIEINKESRKYLSKFPSFL